MEDHQPPPEACGRVTDPARYQRLWAAADQLLDQLAGDFQVDRREGPDVGDDLGTGAAGGVHKLARLSPRNDGAPLTIAFTGFPGLVVRYGRWHLERYPNCGCDACAEDPDQLTEELARNVGDLTAGRFSERLTYGWRPALEFSYAGRHRGSRRLRLREAVDYGRPRTHSWPAWPQRDPGR